MADRYDALVARTDKNGKTWWTKIGTMWPAKEGDGYALTLDALPLTGSDGQARIVMKVPKPKEQQSTGVHSYSPDGQVERAERNADMNDDIPF